MLEIDEGGDAIGQIVKKWGEHTLTEVGGKVPPCSRGESITAQHSST
jgi:hypothetical protein